MKDENEVPSEEQDEPSRPSEMARRNFLKGPAAVAVTAVSLPSVLSSLFTMGSAKAATGQPTLDPECYPRNDLRPEVDLHGKVAVITGASRGIGRAAAEALAALAVEVIGTSRDASHVPHPPAYTLLDLDITDPPSVRRFVAALTRKLRGRKVDILVNNAGRFVLGNVISPPTSTSKFQLDQLQLGTQTLYLGHVAVTNEILPLMPTQGYARVLFTVSVAGYLVGGTDELRFCRKAWGPRRLAVG